MNFALSLLLALVPLIQAPRERFTISVQEVDGDFVCSIQARQARLVDLLQQCGAFAHAIPTISRNELVRSPNPARNDSFVYSGWWFRWSTATIFTVAGSHLDVRRPHQDFHRANRSP